MRRTNNADTLTSIDEQLGGVLPLIVKNEIETFRLAQSELPGAARKTGTAEKGLARAKKQSPVDDAENIRKNLKAGGKDKKLPRESVVVAAEKLAEAKRYQAGVRLLMTSTLSNIAEVLRADDKFPGKLERIWMEQVHHTLDRQVESFATVANQDRVADNCAAAIFEAVCVLDAAGSKYHRSLLRRAFDARTPGVPRLAQLLKAVEDEKRGVEQAAAASQIRRDSFRAAAEGRTVSPGRDAPDETEKASLRTTAARRSGNLEKATK